MTEQTLNDTMEDLLDGTLDDLADMPEFKPFPAGGHLVTINWDYSKFASDKTITLKATGIATVEMGSNPEGTEPIKAGDTTQQTFFMKKKDGTKNEYSEGQWKELLKPLGAHFGVSSLKDIMDASQNAEVIVVTKVKKNDKDKHDIKYNTDFVSIAVQ